MQALNAAGEIYIYKEQRTVRAFSLARTQSTSEPEELIGRHLPGIKPTMTCEMTRLREEAALAAATTDGGQGFHPVWLSLGGMKEAAQP